MAIYKIIVTGSFNSGKTTFVRAISEIEPITTDKPVSEPMLKIIKPLTTVAMDFGVLTVDKDLVLHIYATPGQERFDVIYDILLKNALALIVLGDATDRGSVSSMRKFFNKFISLKKLPAVFALTKVDLPHRLPDEEINMALGGIPSDIPILKINATHKEDVKKTLLTALQRLLDEA